MRSNIHRNIDQTKLRLGIALFFVCMSIPTIVLVKQSYSQLKWEAFHQHWVMAEELSIRIDSQFGELVNREEQRSFTDYSFLVVTGDIKNSFLQRSPLSEFPPAGDLPGLIGYFQIDAQGQFSTPLIPQNANAANYGVAKEQLQQRQALQNQIQQVLAQNQLMQVRPQQIAVNNPAPATSTYEILADQSSRERDKLVSGTGITSAPLLEAEEQLDADDSLSLSEIAVEPEPAVQTQAAFDRLGSLQTKSKSDNENISLRNIGRVEDLQLDEGYQQKLNREVMEKKETGKTAKVANLEESTAGIRSLAKSSPAAPVKRASRRELRASPDEMQFSQMDARYSGDIKQTKIRIFEGEIDPFEFSLLESGHLVLFRKVWRDGQRYIQGILIEQQPFIHNLIENAFRDTALSQMSDLAIAYQGNIITALSSQRYQNRQKYLSSAEQLRGSLLYQASLSAPFDGMQLIFSINELPAGPGTIIINWLVVILASVLCIGLWLIYRLGTKQIALVRQQQDFVSSVSHELKTPLTSIRMYGEMLREGWADEKKKKSYYEFIHDESERLSRLIANVLQLARMTRNDLQVDLRAISIGELMDTIRSKIVSQVEHAGFNVNIQYDERIADTEISLDADFFSQIVINLVDNAIKFSVKAEQKTIEIEARRLTGNEIVFSVRDYGPGIPKNQIRKIFQLFYRSENELTRETVGTGIGLALVHKLTTAMRGRVDVINRNPGAEFRLTFPIVG
ncbi:MAG: HAMP domain-containing histidine kinase [Gammaproteobacteria bacterium]|nr:HAMP domain-containing histidine kinase [Gammaproteobacteria bacterium]